MFSWGVMVEFSTGGREWDAVRREGAVGTWATGAEPSVEKGATKGLGTFEKHCCLRHRKTDSLHHLCYST